MRYANYALLASMVQDDLLIRSLHQIYLSPLDDERDGGQRLRQTLQAYLAANGQISSTAAKLGVSRKTVSNRLYAAEDRLGKSLGSCGPDLAAALTAVSPNVFVYDGSSDVEISLTPLQSLIISMLRVAITGCEWL